MPFSVFRRHQRKLLAVFGLMAMVSFVLSDSLPALMRSGGSQQTDPLVAKINGRKIYRSDLGQLAADRGLANAFMGNLMQGMIGFAQPQFFGDTSTSSLVDAMILEHEADRLGLPRGAELARQWLTQITGGQMDASLFESLLTPFRSGAQGVSGDQMLLALGSQIRLLQVRSLPGQAVVTPLDIYQAYRDRYESVSARAVPFRVSDMLNKVGEPTDAQVADLFERYKDDLPDPSRPTPGFRIPRRVRVEYLTLNGLALENELRAQLTDEELRNEYDARGSEFALPTPTELPAALFADDPENALTPPPADPKNLAPELRPDPDAGFRPFAEVRPILEADLAEEKARDAIDRRFEEVREAMHDHADLISDIRDANEERGGSEPEPLPAKPDLKPFATRADLVLETTPLLARDEAANQGQISTAQVGFSRSPDGRSFVDEFFAEGDILFEPIEMSDAIGRVYLAWKVEDQPTRVPGLEEIRPEVVRAWKTEQARPLTLKAAEELASKAQAAGGMLTTDLVDGRTILTTDMLTRLESASLPMPGQFSPPRPRPTAIPQIPTAGEALRDALFGLEQGQVAVAPDEPMSAYYVLALDRRNPVGYTSLYAPTGPRMTIQSEVLDEARERKIDDWMGVLREQAGLPADWSPPDEASDGRDRRQG